MSLSLQFVNLRKRSQLHEVEHLQQFGEEFDDFMEESERKRWVEPLPIQLAFTLPLTSPPQG